jgi:hypothetical protein
MTGMFAVVFVAAATTVAHAAMPAGGYHPDESEYGVSANGTTINGTYTAPNNQMFYVGGYQFGPDLAGNVAAITCSDGGTAQLTGGPGGAPECLWSAPRASASVTITGRSAWPSTFTVTPFWSFDNRTYVLGSPVEVESELTEQTAGCDGRVYRILVWPKGHGEVKSTGFEAYDEPHADLYTGKGKTYSDNQLGAYVGGAGHIELGPACAGQTSTKVSASDESLKASAIPAAKLVVCNLKTSGVVNVSHDASDAAGFLSLFESSGKEVLTVSADDSGATLGFDSARCKATNAPK